MAKIDKDSLGYLGLDYQMRFVAQLLTDNRFAQSIIDIVDPNYFADPYLRVIVATIKDAKEHDDIIPDMGSIEFRLLEDIKDDIQQKYAISQLNKIKNTSLYDTLKVQDIAMKFCKQQELKKSIKSIQTIIDKGDFESYDECESILRKALEHGDSKDDTIDVLDNIDSILSDDFRQPIRTGIGFLDEVMNGGLSKGELALILAPFGVGKAQPLTSKILTPNGWTTMGDIKVGDQVISRDGKPTKVVGVYPQGIRPIYKISFNDGTSTFCDKEHLWAVNTINQRNRKTKKDGKGIYLAPDNTFKTISTSDMIDNVKVWGNRRLNYKVPNVQPIEFDKKDLLIDPYLLGVILGDGCITTDNQPHFVTKDIEIINEVSKVTNISVTEQIREIEKEIDGELVLVKRSLTKVSLLGIKNLLTSLALYGTNSSSKFIPKDYLYTSVSDRVSILQGLVDTDGYINKHTIEIATVSKQLAEDIRELVLSLGGRVSVTKKQGSYRKLGIRISTQKYYRISFSFPDNNIVPSRLTRKISRFNPRIKYGSNKFISGIEYSHEEEAQCIMVDNPEHLYVTDDYIVTHNTTMITKMANTAMNDGYNVIQIFFEDNPKVIQRKHVSCWTGIDLNDLSLHTDAIINLKDEKNINPKGQIKLKKFPSAGTTIPMIRQYIRKKIAEGFRPDIILLDYIDCVAPSRRYDDANIGEGSVMREFESMLDELNLAGWTAVQGNRSSIKATVVESDQMGGSIKKGQIGHFIVSIAKSLDQKENGTATMAILKSRFGKDGLIFEDIIFNNSTIQIENNEFKGGRTQVEHRKDVEVNNQQRVNDLLNATRLRREALNNGN
jgi:hypothetical protein